MQQFKVYFLCGLLTFRCYLGNQDNVFYTRLIEDEILEYLLAVSKNLAHPLHPVYDDGKGGGYQWWVKRCKSTDFFSG